MFEEVFDENGEPNHFFLVREAEEGVVGTRFTEDEIKRSALSNQHRP